MYDVLIIGCGIIGAATAFELSKKQLKVCVLEKENDVAMGTTKANSAMLHAGFDPEPNTLMAKLNVQGAAMAKQLCADLDVHYKQIGALVIAFNEQDEKYLQKLLANGQKNGVQGLEILPKEKVIQLEPNINPDITSALFAPSAAIVNPWQMCLALAEVSVQNGVQIFLNKQVINIEKQNGVYSVQTDSGCYTAKYIINAAGINAQQIHCMVAEKTFETLPSRGEYYLLDKQEGERVKHVIFQCPTKLGKGVLVSPTVHGNLIVGPNAIASDLDDTTVTQDGLQLVAEMAKKSVPTVDLRYSIRNFAGVRSNTNKDDFVIEEVENSKGFIDLAGIKSPGLTAAPAIAKMAVELLLKSGLDAKDKKSPITTRKMIWFDRLSTEEKQKLIQKQPAYGRVVCRCETITEGEILQAIKSPITPCSVDGIKRRCNAGMGRCQGGFCGPKVVEILARELNVQPTDILQDQKGSFILTGKTKEGR